MPRSANQAAAALLASLSRFQYSPPNVIVEILGFGEGKKYIPNPFRYPLILDLDGKAIDLTPASASSAHFDVNADGTTPQVGWVGKTNGILVLDRNGNGVIDDATEWFGEKFAADGTPPPTGQRGFNALATLAAPGSTAFSRETAGIDPNTGASYFDTVKVWVDANSDGVTDAGELRMAA